MNAPQVSQVLKRDVFGRIELLTGPRGPVVRRVVSGAAPGAGWVGRVLLGRERRALARLGALPGVPQLVEDGDYLAAPPGPGPCLLRTYLPGLALWEATALPLDFFERLEDLVVAVHDCGVCHNDLAKENNVLVREDGRPGLVDFQLASVHRRRGRGFRRRVAEDLRHVAKHRRRYERAAGGAGTSVAPRSALSRLWRASGKPLLRLLSHGLLRVEDGEPRRPRSGPWPERTPALGPPRR